MITFFMINSDIVLTPTLSHEIRAGFGRCVSTSASALVCRKESKHLILSYRLFPTHWSSVATFEIDSAQIIYKKSTILATSNKAKQLKTTIRFSRAAITLGPFQPNEPKYRSYDVFFHHASHHSARQASTR